MLHRLKQIIEDTHPEKLLLFGYLFYFLLGWAILLLPACHLQPASVLDNLFTAASAVSTTGLLTVPLTEIYSFSGQLVVLILIQIGGIGYTTFASFVVLSATQRLPKIQEKVVHHTFPLPKGFSMPEFLRHVVYYTFVCEAVGAVFLTFLFRKAGVEHPLWNGIFHSISAFCTAGISLFPTGFEAFAHNLPLNLAISVLCILGAMGFIVWLDLYKRIVGKKDHMTVTSRIILSVTFWSLILGTALIFLTTSFPEGFSLFEKWIAAFFQSMTSSSTAGFNTLNIGTFAYSTITLLLFLMAFGASPSGTGGGLKSTTFTALIGLVKSTLRGQEEEISFWGHPIPHKRMSIATSSLAFYIFVLGLSLFTLTWLEDLSFVSLLFEASSALSNVGLSMGATASLSPWGKLFIVVCMLIGRVGILTFGVALLVPKKEKLKKEDEHDIVF